MLADTDVGGWIHEDSGHDPQASAPASLTAVSGSISSGVYWGWWWTM